MLVGLLSPIAVNDKGECYEIIYGERRYHACVKAGMTKIPCFICQVSEEEARRMAIAENVERKNINLIQEALAYQKLIDLRKDTVADLAAWFGEEESHIRSRLALLYLIADFKALVINERLTLAKAYELARYSAPIQTLIYKNHFCKDDGSSWEHLRTKHFKKRLEEAFSDELSGYEFDKTQCATCAHNTANQSLFADPGNARCTDKSCLFGKKHKHLDQVLKQIKKEKEKKIEVCISSFDGPTKQVKSELKGANVTVLGSQPIEIPKIPDAPRKENFAKVEDFEEAQRQYLVSCIDYQEEVEVLKAKEEAGEIKEAIYITGSNVVRKCYCPVENEEKENLETLAVLEERAKRNKEAIAENMLKDCLAFFKKRDVGYEDLSEQEESLILYLMIPYLKKEHYHFFGLSEKEELTDKVQFKIYNALTADQKNLIRRDFLIHFLTKTKGNSKKTFLLFELIESYYPVEYKATRAARLKEYKEKSEEIEEKKKRLAGKKQSKETVKAE